VDVGGTFQAENVKDGHLTGTLDADAFEGTVILESRSYSRAEPVASSTSTGSAGPFAPPEGKPAFSYGALPSVPVRFQTGPRATQLLLQGNAFEGGNRTWVTLFDDHGGRIGTWSVATKSTVAIPVAPSATYIAARLRGNATLGADAAPADFDLHPMQVRSQVVPGPPAGNGRDYGMATEAIDGAGVYGIEAIEEVPSPSPATVAQGQCPTGLLVRVAQRNETLGAWGDERGPVAFSDAALRLHDGPLEVVYDGVGANGCAHPAARVLRFQP
jgi:hypothetical protein